MSALRSNATSFDGQRQRGGGGGHPIIGNRPSSCAITTPGHTVTAPAALLASGQAIASAMAADRPSATDVDVRAAANRLANPEAAAFVDAVRAVFPGAIVTYLGPARPHRHLQHEGDNFSPPSA